jgi:glutamyl-tRNA reductase
VEQIISNFWIIGINYKKTDATIRGQYTINNEQYTSILDKAPLYGLKEFFILSTCNRTEIYALTENIDNLINLLCSETAGSKDTFQKLCYQKQGREAVEHLFEVSGGLDSQVLGDYEIVGQVKQAAKFSKQQGVIGPFLERLINIALQSSKAIKNTTELSGGTVSVSFAAIQYIRENVADFNKKKILLLGTGKIGRNTCKNLVDYLRNRHITLINRSPEKASLLAEAMGLRSAPVQDTARCIRESDIIIACTNASQPIITAEHVAGGAPKVLIDLAIPYNIDPALGDLEHVTLLNVDELSKLKDSTLQKRVAEVPKAKAIIAEHIREFLNWLELRKHVPVLKSLKKKLEQIECGFLVPNGGESAPSAQKIQKVINTTAVKLQSHNNRGCYYIEAINEFIAG